MADPAPAAPSPAPSPAAPAPGSLTGTTYAPAPAARPSGPISDTAFDRLSGSDQSAYMRVRTEAGSEWVPRSDLQPAPKPAAAPGEPPAPPAPPAAPASVVDGKLRVGDYELSADDIASLMATKAQADLRATQVPANPESYQAKLPDGFKLPEGVGEFKFNEADPALRDMRAWAHGKGIDQATFSEMLGFYASSEAQKEAAFRAAQAAEVAKLGNFGTSRVTAIETWLRSELGDDLANGMRSMMVTEKIVRGFEKLAAQRTTQGAAPFSQAHRTPEPAPGPGRVTEDVYNAMTQAERFAYARGFDQSQFRNSNGGPER